MDSFVDDILGERWKKWFKFGVGMSLIWNTALALVIVSFMATLAAIFGAIFNVSLAPIFAGVVAFGILGLGVVILVNAVLWVLVGRIYDSDLAGMFRKLPIVVQLTAVNTFAAYAISLITGGTATLVLLALLIPLLIIAIIVAVLTVWTLDYFDWEIPLKKEG